MICSLVRRFLVCSLVPSLPYLIACALVCLFALYLVPVFGSLLTTALFWSPWLTWFAISLVFSCFTSLRKPRNDGFSTPELCLCSQPKDPRVHYDAGAFIFLKKHHFT